MRAILLVILALTLSSCQSSHAPRYVITEGSATLRVPIEEIRVNISVDSDGKTLAEANQSLRATVLRAFAELKQMGISDSDFVTDRHATNFRTRRTDDVEQPGMSYAGSFPLRNPDRYDELMKAMTAIGRIQVSIAGYSNRHLDDYRSQVYNQAFAKAKKEAEMLLAPSGSSVGKVLKVLKRGYDPFDQYDNADKEMDRRGGDVAYSVRTTPLPDYEKIFRRKYFEVSQDVTVMFEIQ